jgi:hypothetical protein
MNKKHTAPFIVLVCIVSVEIHFINAKGLFFCAWI